MMAVSVIWEASFIMSEILQNPKCDCDSSDEHHLPPSFRYECNIDKHDTSTCQRLFETCLRILRIFRILRIHWFSDLSSSVNCFVSRTMSICPHNCLSTTEISNSPNNVRFYFFRRTPQRDFRIIEKSDLFDNQTNVSQRKCFQNPDPLFVSNLWWIENAFSHP